MAKPKTRLTDISGIATDPKGPAGMDHDKEVYKAKPRRKPTKRGGLSRMKGILGRKGKLSESEIKGALKIKGLFPE